MTTLRSHLNGGCSNQSYTLWVVNGCTPLYNIISLTGNEHCDTTNTFIVKLLVLAHARYQ